MKRPWWRQLAAWLLGETGPGQPWPPDDPHACAVAGIDQLEAHLRDIAEGRRTP